MKLKKLTVKSRLNNTFITLFFENLKLIFKSKAFWVFVIVIALIFIIVKSLNLINSIYGSIDSFMNIREGTFRWDKDQDLATFFLKANESDINFINSQEYVNTFYGISFNRLFMERLVRMDIFYNFSIIVLVLITSNIVLFKKIRTGSILIYLSTPITKTKIMGCGFLASLLASFLILFFLHSMEIVFTSIINNSIKESDLKEKVNFWANFYVTRQFTYSQIFTFFNNNSNYRSFKILYIWYNDSVNRTAAQIHEFLSSWSPLSYLEYFIFALTSSALYLLIILPLCFVLQLFMKSITKASVILIIFTIFFGIVASIISISVLNPDDYIYGLRSIFWPSLIRDFYIYLLKDYSRFNFNLLETFNNVHAKYPFVVFQGDISVEFNGNWIIKNLVTSEMFYSKKVVFSILPITAFLFLLPLPFIYRRVDWK